CFFFQAEDGIRDATVTGVQTCALPIYRRRAQDLEGRREVVGETLDDERVAAERQVGAVLLAGPHRHEEAGIALENETHLVGDKEIGRASCRERGEIEVEGDSKREKENR